MQPAEVLRAQVSPPQVLPAQLVQRVSLGELLPALGPLVLQPPVDEQAQPEKQLEPPQAPVACVKPPSPPLLSPNARLPPRIRRPLRPSGVA